MIRADPASAPLSIPPISDTGVPIFAAIVTPSRRAGSRIRDGVRAEILTRRQAVRDRSAPADAPEIVSSPASAGHPRTFWWRSRAMRSSVGGCVWKRFAKFTCFPLSGLMM
jgi:hypothetical protein